MIEMVHHPAAPCWAPAREEKSPCLACFIYVTNTFVALLPVYQALFEALDTYELIQFSSSLVS